MKKTSLEDNLPRINTWFSTERGQSVLQEQYKLIEHALEQCFGYHLLQLSVSTDAELYRDCGVQRKFRCHPKATHHHLNADFEQLPFATESIDAVIVHHVHEYMDNPHQLLRELQRIVVPHGHIIILGFNPWSPLGLYSLVRRRFPNTAWKNNLISHRKITDWLSLLGFQIKFAEFGHFQPQRLNHTRKLWLRYLLRSTPLGSFYMVNAVKHQATLIPLKPVWENPRKHFGGLSPIKPRVSSSKSIKS